MRVVFCSILMCMVLGFISACGSVPAPSQNDEDIGVAAQTLPSQKQSVDHKDASQDLTVNKVVAQELSFHGLLYGERFWLDLSAPDSKQGSVRTLRILYTPPFKDAYEGIARNDHPHVLVNDALFCGLWKERSNLTGYVYQGGGEQPGYAVTMEREEEIDGDRIAYEDTRFVPGNPVWDLDITPMLLAIIWSPGQHGTVNAMRLAANEEPQLVLVSWDDTQVRIGAADYIIKALDGKFQSLHSSDGSTVLTIQSWLTYTE